MVFYDCRRMALVLDEEAIVTSQFVALWTLEAYIDPGEGIRSLPILHFHAVFLVAGSDSHV